MWIFSTSLTEASWKSIQPATPWKPGIPPRLISVGRLSEGKNIQAAISALPRILEAYPGTTLDVLGEGTYRPELERLIAELGLVEQVTLHGNVRQEEVLRRLRQSHLFVFPTRTREGFPKAVLEALACGLPVIAPPVSVIPYLLGQGGGVILPDSGHEAVSNMVLALLADPPRLAAMAKNARATSRDYTLERWRITIRDRLREQWGPLANEA